MEGARRRKQEKQEQQQQGGRQAKLGDGRTPTDPETTRAGEGNAAADPSSAPATGLEAVRMRLRESLAAKPEVGEGGDDAEKSPN